MSHTIVEMYVKVVPVNSFRKGAKNSSQLHKLRAMPPRTIEQSFDIGIFKNNGVDYVSKDTGGISTFDQERPGFGAYWWKIPKGTKIPLGLRISRDFNPKPPISPTHYTLRPAFDMPLRNYISLLEELALSMELEVKEMRLVILGLKKLLQGTLQKMEETSEDDDEHIFLSNDAMLIDTMIKSFEQEYKEKYTDTKH